MTNKTVEQNRMRKYSQISYSKMIYMSSWIGKKMMNHSIKDGLFRELIWNNKIKSQFQIPISYIYIKKKL